MGPTGHMGKNVNRRAFLTPQIVERIVRFVESESSPPGQS